VHSFLKLNHGTLKTVKPLIQDYVQTTTNLRYGHIKLYAFNAVQRE